MIVRLSLKLLPVLAILAPAGVAQATLSWEETTISSSFGNVASLSAGDLDGDGDRDLLAGSSLLGVDEIRWFEVEALGSSWTEHAIATESFGLRDLVAADIDGDGDLDALAAAGSRVAWYENTAGDGSSWTRWDIVSGALVLARSTWTLDVDSDGDLDVVTGSLSLVGQSVIWYENLDGTGSGWSAHGIPTSTFETTRVRAFDLDRDGDPDLLAEAENEGVELWLENASGNGVSWIEHALPSSFTDPRALSPGDLNCDGGVDIALLSPSTNAVAWLENLGAASSWAQATVSTVPQTPRDVLVLDLDADGDLDLATASAGDDSVRWFENVSGDALIWTEQTVSTTAPGVEALESGDAASDGGLDLISASLGTATLALHENPAALPPESWSDETLTVTLGDVTSASTVDLDGDGDVDALFSSEDDDRVVYTENFAGDGSLWNLRVITTSADGATSAAAGDADGDGDLDVFATAGLADTVAWYENDGGPAAPTWPTHQVQAPWLFAPHAAVPVDFDGDGDEDLLTVSEFDDRVSWWENADGDGAAWLYFEISTQADGPQAGCAADIDGDAAPDAVTAADSGLLFHRNVDGNGGAWLDVSVDNSGSSYDAVLATDIDGDGDLDLVSLSRQFQASWHENMDGLGQTWSTSLIDGSFTEIAIGTGDVDGNGAMDILVSSAAFSSIAWYRNVAGDGTAWARQSISNSPGQPTALFPTDVDGDFDLDVLATDSTGDQVHFYENTAADGSAWTSTLVGSSEAPDQLAGGDLDGDGDLDVVSKGTVGLDVVYMANLDGNGDSWSTVAVSTGLSNVVDSLDTADIDGDGDQDVTSTTLFSNEVTWHGNLLGDGTSWVDNVVSNPFLATITPCNVAVGDIDGDGDVDAAVASAGGFGISWHANTLGDGTRWSAAAIDTAMSVPRLPLLADVDLDGDLDLVMGRGSSFVVTPTVTWIENVAGDGSSWFETVVFSPFFGSGSNGLDTGDTDGDGDLDIAAANTLDGVVVHENELGDGSSWGFKIASLAPQDARDVVLLELDGDGDLDLAFASESDDTIGWLENTEGDATRWFLRTVATTGDEASEVCAADIDADGDVDLLSAGFEFAAWHQRTPPPATPYGCSVNPAGSLRLTEGLPQLGAGFTLAVDNPLGTQGSGSIPLLFRSLAPAPSFPCGTQLTRFGMSGPGAASELLLSLLPAELLSGQITGPAWAGPGCPSLLTVNVPNDANLVELSVYFQAALIDAPGAAVPIGLTNGMRLTIQP